MCLSEEFFVTHSPDCVILASERTVTSLVVELLMVDNGIRLHVDSQLKHILLNF